MPYNFKTSWRVRFDECDLQGMVHHTQIVKYLEIARIDFLRHLGMPYKQMLEDGYEFIIRRVAVRYRKPLRFEEIIEVKVGILKMGRASFYLSYKVYNQAGVLAVEGETEQLCADAGAGKPIALPKKYLEALKRA